VNLRAQQLLALIAAIPAGCRIAADEKLHNTRSVRLHAISCRHHFFIALGVAVAFGLMPFKWGRAQCDLVTDNIPLNDLGPNFYHASYQGGLYPGGSNQRPSDHETDGINIATNQIKPLNSNGIEDQGQGKIVMISIGMSNTTQEFGGEGEEPPVAFKPRVDDAVETPNKNPRLVIVDGAQATMDAEAWGGIQFNRATWDTLRHRIRDAGVFPAQVQIAWIKQALVDPGNYGDFPTHATRLQGDLERILQTLKQKYPSCLLAYFSTRTRAYTTTFHSPEPFAYETGFANKWTIEDQLIHALLNYNLSNGPVVAPWISWGPYLWTNGTTPRSDGLMWQCTSTGGLPSDVESDFVHPSALGEDKVADQLLAFFETDPTATPWFLKKNELGQDPAVSATYQVLSTSPLKVQFTAQATAHNGGSIKHFVWTFDDGDYAYDNKTPTKSFPAPGAYKVHLTVIDDTGNSTQKAVPVTVN